MEYRPWSFVFNKISLAVCGPGKAGGGGSIPSLATSLPGGIDRPDGDATLPARFDRSRSLKFWSCGSCVFAEKPSVIVAAMARRLSLARILKPAACSPDRQRGLNDAEKSD